MPKGCSRLHSVPGRKAPHSLDLLPRATGSGVTKIKIITIKIIIITIIFIIIHSYLMPRN